jgi:hypothetical protein
MEDAVARQTAMAGSSTPPRKPRALEGPVCVSCHHGSCDPVRVSRIRNTWTEDPISGETSLVNFAAMEEAWIVTNTATTWARVVAEESGRPIPPETPREPAKGEPRRVLVQRKRYTMVPADRPDRCDYSDLPIDTCACGHSHERTTV